ncbi:cytochrome C oxidase subunit IV family protein [Streptomyces sp. NPDC051985]|uniref:cytochrome C oxidase subunit IV family protein n=1 Tax=Streptomyces sp. NPDC051985 TaxID=3155807 RepID=UPI0034247E06
MDHHVSAALPDEVRPTKPPSRDRALHVVWLALMMLTCASAWLLTDGPFGPPVATVGVFLIAAVKARWVILRFMELRAAPIAVRLFFEGASFTVTALLLAVYSLTP